MKLLLHICCAPCTIYPLKILRQDGHEVRGCFFNPNIHPYLEYKKRRDTLQDYAAKERLQVLWDEIYPMESFMRNVAFHEEDRCSRCYDMRLRYAAETAKAGDYEGFTTTLLYSKHQKHDVIKAIGEKLASEYGVPFLYKDFREGWQEGVDISRSLGLYRQPYCGCLYSEKERYRKNKKDG